MTFKEFNLCLQAHCEEKYSDIERWRNTLAWHAACIINAIPMRKHAVTPKQLLGRQPKELTELYASKEEFEASLKSRQGA